MKKWEQLQSTFDNLKCGMGQGDYLDKKQKLFKTMSIRVIIYEFYRFCSERNRWEKLTSGIFSTKVCMEFDF